MKATKSRIRGTKLNVSKKRHIKSEIFEYFLKQGENIRQK